MQLSSTIFWVAGAILLFWALGGYNRLVRLRSAAIQAFGGLDAHFMHMVAMLGECDAAQPVHGPQAAVPLADAAAALRAATAQFNASLAVARAQPLQPGPAAALQAALQAVHAAWQALVVRAREAGPDDGMGVQLAPWLPRWEQQQAENAVALRQFNAAAAQYNTAVAQFPAQLLAWAFGLRPAPLMDLPEVRA